jgi:hypothetical protein
VSLFGSAWAQLGAVGVDEILNLLRTLTAAPREPAA